MSQLPFTAHSLQELAVVILADLEALPPSERANKLAHELQGIIEAQTSVVTRKMLDHLNDYGHAAHAKSKTDGDLEMRHAHGIFDAESELTRLIWSAEWPREILALSKDEADAREKVRRDNGSL